MQAQAQQMLMERVGEGILQVAEQEEKKLDAQLAKLEHLGNLMNNNNYFHY
jgi:hypothetical protein